MKINFKKGDYVAVNIPIYHIACKYGIVEYVECKSVYGYWGNTIEDAEINKKNKISLTWLYAHDLTLIKRKINKIEALQ